MTPDDKDPVARHPAPAAIPALGWARVERDKLCLDLICASLNNDVRRALEDEMQVGKYETSSTIARYFEEQGPGRATRTARAPRARTARR